MSSQIEELGKMLGMQMQNTMRANSGITVEFGRINSNLSLSVSSLENTIPKGDYMVSRHISGSGMSMNTSKENDHIHSVSLPSRLKGLQAGDRVLVAWVGTEPVVVDILVSS